MTDYSTRAGSYGTGSYGQGGSARSTGGYGGRGDDDMAGYGSGYGGRMGMSRGRQGQQGQGQGSSGIGNAYQMAPLVVGGLMAALGIRRGGWLGYGIALAGLGVMQQSFTGKPAIQEWIGMGGDHSDHESRAVTASQSVTINRSPEDLYSFWRDFSNLPQVLSNIERVDVIDDRRSHWVAKAPGGMHVSWDAEVTDDQKDRRIAWRAQEDADVPNWGHVEFRPAPGGRGTELHAVIRYEPPAGMLGRMVAKMFMREPQEQMRHDLQQFKRMMEMGAGSMGAGSMGAGATGGLSGSSSSSGAGSGSMGSGSGTATGSTAGTSSATGSKSTTGSTVSGDI